MFKAIKARLQRTDPQFVYFTKTRRVLDQLYKRVLMKSDKLKFELLQAKHLQYIEKQFTTYQGIGEPRFCCYFFYPEGNGKVFVITFNGSIKIITVFPLGKRTVKKQKRRIYKK